MSSRSSASPAAADVATRFLVPAVAAALAVAGLLVALRPLLFAPRPAAELLTVLAPTSVEAAERFVVFAGVRADGPARVWIRVCSTARRCQLERGEPFAAGTTFKWIASPDLAPGTYVLDAFLQVRTPFGYRSVDRFTGHVAAR